MDFSNVRIPWNYPPYPPYHEGLYLEEYFYSFYVSNKNLFDDIGYTLIPIFWTSAYINQINVQPYIDFLPKGKKYFCVSQHDDSVKEKLPENTIIFSAGGNSGGIPIPLVCSSAIKEDTILARKKDIFCSFVGSRTHSVRERMISQFDNDIDFYIRSNVWSFNIESRAKQQFFDITSRSKFTLCPRGYGAQSFRFYEALQLGSIPIYIHDDNIFRPYSDIIDWDTFSITIHVNDIANLKNILKLIPEPQIDTMVMIGREVYNKFFKMENLPHQILTHLRKI
jgi:hypothetical protein